MPDETRAIEPALTLEEWYNVKESDRQSLHEAAGAMMQAFMPDVDGPGLGRTTSERLAACMALANVGLSKSNPHKITHEEIAACRSFDFDFRAANSASVEVSRANCDAIQRLAAKLAGLLPPET
jgi:hypothetical protein